MLISHTFTRSESNDAPLVLLVHGRSGTYQVMQMFKSVIPESATIVSVQAPLEDPEGGFRWWHFKAALEFTADFHSDASVAAQTFTDWLSEFLKQEALKPQKIVAIGFSQGAALLSYIIQKQPELFNAVAMLAGFVVKYSESVESSASKTQVLVAHGTNDETVPLSIAEDGVEYLKQQGYQITLVTDPVGHKIGVNGMKTLKMWLKEVILG